MIKKFILPILFVLAITSCKRSHEPKPDFSFVFLTDIHVQPEKRATEGFQQAIDKVNKLKPDFAVTGGDLIMDALGQSRGRADSLYLLYSDLSKGFNMPVYNTVGNHELFAFYTPDIDSTDPDYEVGMYRRHLGEPWQSFEYKGWHFILLKSVEQTESRGYQGEIGQDQIEWLKRDLAAIPDTMPVVVSVHIPLISAYGQWANGGLQANGPGITITNGKEVLDILKGKNLKLVLQGHLHCLEDYYVDGVHFITGGAVSANWWNGPYRGMEEGFLLIKVFGQEIEWQYVDLGWEAGNQGAS